MPAFERIPPSRDDPVANPHCVPWRARDYEHVHILMSLVNRASAHLCAVADARSAHLSGGGEQWFPTRLWPPAL